VVHQCLPPDLPEWLNEVCLAVENETPLVQVFMMRAINAVLRFTELSEDSIVALQGHHVTWTFS